MKNSRVFQKYANDVIKATSKIDGKLATEVGATFKDISSYVNLMMFDLVDRSTLQPIGTVDYNFMLRNLRSVLSKIETEINRQYNRLASNVGKKQKQVFTTYRGLLQDALGKLDVKTSIISEADVNVSFGGTISKDFQKQLQSQFKAGTEPATLIKTVSQDHVREIHKQMMIGVSKGKGFQWSRDKVIKNILPKGTSDVISRKMEYNVTRIMRTSYMTAVNNDTTAFIGKNKNIFMGSIRVADGRPCYMCTMLDGKFYPPDIPLYDEHPNGMCILVPLMYPPEFFLTGKITKSPIDFFGLTLKQKFFKATVQEQKDIFGNKSLYDLWEREQFDMDSIMYMKNGMLTQWGYQKTLENLPKIGSISYPKIKVSKDLNIVMDAKDRNKLGFTAQRRKPVGGKKNGIDLIGDGSNYMSSSISNELKMRIHTQFDLGIKNNSWIAFNERARFLGIFTRMDKNNEIYYIVKGD